ncbi:MAG: YcgN family cysteine cluster protein [Pseudolabrys sp.]
MSDEPAPFWRRKKLSEMTDREWESLCDGCGRCCLNKLIDEDTNETVFTDVGCALLDATNCRCTDYKNRQARVSDCVRLTWRNVKRLTWLPPTCGYRIVARGEDLPWWHPLVSGRPETVHEAGISVRGRVSASEADVPDEKLGEYVVAWPGKWPKGGAHARRQSEMRARGRQPE